MEEKWKKKKKKRKSRILSAQREKDFLARETRIKPKFRPTKISERNANANANGALLPSSRDSLAGKKCVASNSRRRPLAARIRRNSARHMARWNFARGSAKQDASWPAVRRRKDALWRPAAANAAPDSSAKQRRRHFYITKQECQPNSNVPHLQLALRSLWHHGQTQRKRATICQCNAINFAVVSSHSHALRHLLCIRCLGSGNAWPGFGKRRRKQLSWAHLGKCVCASGNK